MALSHRRLINRCRRVERVREGAFLSNDIIILLHVHKHTHTQLRTSSTSSSTLFLRHFSIYIWRHFHRTYTAAREYTFPNHTNKRHTQVGTLCNFNLGKEPVGGALRHHVCRNVRKNGSTQRELMRRRPLDNRPNFRSGRRCPCPVKRRVATKLQQMVRHKRFGSEVEHSVDKLSPLFFCVRYGSIAQEANQPLQASRKSTRRSIPIQRHNHTAAHTQTHTHS